jgi:hypothetical protein
MVKPNPVLSQNLTPRESEILFRGFVLSLTASFLGVLLTQLITHPSSFASQETPEEEE